MRLIDLDQTVFVPIVDESKGGVSYEMRWYKCKRCGKVKLDWR